MTMETQKDAPQQLNICVVHVAKIARIGEDLILIIVSKRTCFSGPHVHSVAVMPYPCRQVAQLCADRPRKLHDFKG